MISGPLSNRLALQSERMRTCPLKLLLKVDKFSLFPDPVELRSASAACKIPLWVNPAPVAVKSPRIFNAWRLSAVESVTVTFSSCPLRALKETVEPNTLLKSPRMMLWFAAAAKLAAPVEVITPLCVIPALVEVADKLVLAVTAPRSSAVLFRIVTRVPVAVTVPVNEFKELFKVTTPLGVPPEAAVVVA